MTGRMTQRLEEARAEAANPKKHAVADLHKLSRAFLGIMLIADDLEEIGDLEEEKASKRVEVEEANKHLAAVRAKTEAEKASFLQMEAEFKRLLAAMRAEFLKAEAELVEAIEARKLAVSDATALAADIVEKAKLEAVAIISGAKTKATELLKAGDAEAQTREQEAESRITEARGTLGAVELEITDANARLSGIRTAIARYAAE